MPPRSRMLRSATAWIEHAWVMPVSDDGVVIRPRSAVDLEACVASAHEVHALDGYPPYLPEDDILAFLVAPDALRAWVATIDGVVVGHVALHPCSTGAAMELASSVAAVPVDGLGVVARLFTSPSARRSGVGRA